MHACIPVASLVDSENSSDPSHNFVGGRIGRLIKINHTILDVLLQRPLQGRATSRDGGIMARAHMQLVIILF